MLKNLFSNKKETKPCDACLAIGDTPLIQIDNIYAKLESVNPSGSIKDRIAVEMVEAAERSGELYKGCTIVEATSGNTGIALSLVAATKGYKMIVVMPENMSKERKQMMRALGAELVLTSAQGSLGEAIEKASEIAKRPNTCYADQFNNPNNVIAQEKTAQEILDEIGPVDAVIAGIGTGGTLMGFSNAMRKANPKVVVIAVEPAEAATIFVDKPKIREHKIQGIGDGFVPPIVDLKHVDEATTVTSQEAIDMTRKLTRMHGLPVGISSGANMLVAFRNKSRFKKIATVLPDRGERYISMGLYDF